MRRNGAVLIEPRRMTTGMLVEAVAGALQANGYQVQAEVRFHPVRRWRFDLAVPDRKVAIEFQGGNWTGGRHVRGAGYEQDAEKLLHAAAAGWVVLPITYDMLRRTPERTMALIAQVLARRPCVTPAPAKRLGDD